MAKMMQSTTANVGINNNRYQYHRNIQVAIIIFFVWYSIVTTFSSSSAWSSTSTTGVHAFTVPSSSSRSRKLLCEQCRLAHSHPPFFVSKGKRSIQTKFKFTRRLLGQSTNEQSPAAATSNQLLPPHNGRNGEVIGATGRIGSYILQKGNGTLAAVPRGVAPGCTSPVGTPIYVAVPSTQLPNVIKSTVKERRKDLVLLSNFVPCDLKKRIGGAGDNDSTEEKDWTTAVLHFGVLSVEGNVVSSENSPPTMIYGRHARALASLLIPDVQVNILEGKDAHLKIEEAAARKLIWGSLMWLLCHEHDGENDSYPITVAKVHETKSNELRQLVKEILPAVDALLGKQQESSNDNDDDEAFVVDEVLSYLEAYSLSMPNAIPNKHLAMDEIEGRNGVLLSVSEQVPQPLHTESIEKVAGGSEVLERFCTTSVPTPPSEIKRNEKDDNLGMLHCDEIGLSFHCQTKKMNKHDEDNDNDKSIVIIGAGIMGTSVALNLARRNVKVTVLDRLPIIANGDIGEATSCTWAWLNANSKKPLSYKLLNALGMTAWRRDGVVKDLPNWCGSLVRYKSSDDDPWCGGAYFAEGPLTMEQMKEIEPTAAFLSNDNDEDQTNGERKELENVYHFPDEGQVDPTRAVCQMRLAAEKLGVRFMGEVEVTDLLRDEEEGGITGVIATSTNNDDSIVLEANEIVVAGGEGAAEEALGGLPMMNHPGTLAFARLSGQGDASKEYQKKEELRHILVDTVTQSHVLCREDGTLVAGGGVLQVGGTSATDKPPIRSSGTADSLAQSEELGKQLLKAASRVAPDALKDTSLVKTMEGRRPIPLDGYPAVGYLEPHLYVVVTHSGMTLSHLLGNIVAGEIAEGVSCNILEEYRPTRFD